MKNALLMGISMAAIGLVMSTSAWAGVTTFDDVSTAPIQWGMPAGYGGFQWSEHWGVMQGSAYDPSPSGYANGVVSPEYVAFNSMGQTVYIQTADSFDLVGAYFSAGWRDGLVIDVEGFLGGSSVGTRSFTVGTAGAQWEAFNWTVDMVTFESSVGAGTTQTWGAGGTQFAMDNLTTRDELPTVPAPGAVILAGLGAGLTGWLRRRKAL